MKKLLIIAILSFAAFPLLGVNFQVTNNKGSQVSLTIKNTVVTDAEHADANDDYNGNDGAITYFRAGEETLAGPTNIANDATADFNIPNANQNHVLDYIPAVIGEVYQFIVIVEWDENAEHKEAKTLFYVFDRPHFTPRYSIINNGHVKLTNESLEELQNRVAEAEDAQEEPNQ